MVRGQGLLKGLKLFEEKVHPLKGVAKSEARETYIEQILESIRRVEYIHTLRQRTLSPKSIDPHDAMFDPIKAAILNQEGNDIEESFWMVFLFIHFGRHRITEWKLIKDVYGRMGTEPIWRWDYISSNVSEFRAWLHECQDQIRRSNTPGGFGNHRKYESLDAYSSSGTGAVVESYIEWVGPNSSHWELISAIITSVSGDKEKAFDELFKSMARVNRFGRTAVFEYLAMVGKLGLALIEPGSPYLANSTGPLRGAKLLVNGDIRTRITISELEESIILLANYLEVGMQVMEDSLCNWQKSPNTFIRFRG